MVESEAYLRKEFNQIPPNIPLTLGAVVGHLAPATGATGKEFNARAWCILAIWSNERHALTTQGIFDALIKEVKYFRDNADAATRRGPNNRPTGWAVSTYSPNLHS